MRLIDKDKMYSVYQEICMGIACISCPFLDCENNKCKLEEMILLQPTIDAVEVVRCKDCKYMTEHYDTDGNVPYWTCSEWDGGTDYDGYCHYGERRENAKVN